MVWQDNVISIANIVLSISLVPQILHGFKTKTCDIKKATSIPIILALSSLVVAYITLSLYLSAIMTATVVIGWIILLTQSIIYSNETLSAH